MRLCLSFDAGLQSTMYIRKKFRKNLTALEKLISSKKYLDFPKDSADTMAMVVITTDKTIKKLNADFRKKNIATDVLTFRNSVSHEFPDEILSGKIHLGEIFISEDTARKQSASHGVTLIEELVLLTVHGLIHLTGLDHEVSKRALLNTRKKEKEILGALGMSHVSPLTNI